MYCGMRKSTCLAEATLNSEKIKLVALAVIEFRLSEGITPSYKLLVTKQVTSYITSYFKSNQLRNLVTKVTSYPQLWYSH